MPLHRSAMGVDNFPSFLQFTYVDHTGDCVSAWSIAIRSAREQKKAQNRWWYFFGNALSRGSQCTLTWFPTSKRLIHKIGDWPGQQIIEPSKISESFDAISTAHAKASGIAGSPAFDGLGVDAPEQHCFARSNAEPRSHATDPASGGTMEGQGHCAYRHNRRPIP